MHDLARRRLAGAIPDAVDPAPAPPRVHGRPAGQARASPLERATKPQRTAARSTTSIGAARSPSTDRGSSWDTRSSTSASRPTPPRYLRSLEAAVIGPARSSGSRCDRRDDVQTGVCRGRRQGLRDRRAPAARPGDAARVRDQLRHRPLVVRRHRGLRAPRPRRHLASAAAGRARHRRRAPADRGGGARRRSGPHVPASARRGRVGVRVGGRCRRDPIPPPRSGSSGAPTRTSAVGRGSPAEPWRGSSTRSISARGAPCSTSARAPASWVGSSPPRARRWSRWSRSRGCVR